MSETSIIAIILSLIAIGGTIGGTWLGRLLERGNETQKWRREHCLNAYIEVLNSCHDVVLEADKNYNDFDCGTWEHINQGKVVNEKIAVMDRILDKAILLGTQEVGNTLYNLVNYCGKEIATKSFNCPKMSKDEWYKIRITDYAIVYSEFRNAARNDLGLFPKRYRVNSPIDIEKEWDRKDRAARKNK